MTRTSGVSIHLIIIIISCYDEKAAAYPLLSPPPPKKAKLCRHANGHRHMKVVKSYTFPATASTAPNSTSTSSITASPTIQIQEVMSSDFGCFMWPSSHVLAMHVWENRQELSGKILLELGGGVGLPGLVAALEECGCKMVYITDRLVHG